MEDSKIEWTDHTWNPWQGCHKVSDACKNCYIEGVMKRASKKAKPFGGPVRTGTWKNPSRLNRRAEQENKQIKMFTCSLSDFFHEGADQWREEAWDIIRECRNIDWQILTKRSHRIEQCLPGDWDEGWENVWLGVTVKRQENVKRLKDLAEVSAVTKFISAEPLLEQFDLREYLGDIDWLITGCEQAAQVKRNEMDTDWVRDIRDQCCEAEVAFFFKQYYGGKYGNTEIRSLRMDS